MLQMNKCVDPSDVFQVVTARVPLFTLDRYPFTLLWQLVHIRVFDLLESPGRIRALILVKD